MIISVHIPQVYICLYLAVYLNGSDNEQSIAKLKEGVTQYQV